MIDHQHGFTWWPEEGPVLHKPAKGSQGYEQILLDVVERVPLLPPEARPPPRSPPLATQRRVSRSAPVVPTSISQLTAPLLESRQTRLHACGNGRLLGQVNKGGGRRMLYFKISNRLYLNSRHHVW